MRGAKTRELGQRLTGSGAGRYRKRHKAVAANYIRKFALAKLVALGVPGSIADFIQGQAANTVRARHCLTKPENAKTRYKCYA